MQASVLFGQFQSFCNDVAMRLLRELECGGTAGDIENRLRRHGTFLLKSSDLVSDVCALIRHRVDSTRIIKLDSDDYMAVAASMRVPAGGWLRCTPDAQALLRKEADDVEQLHAAGGLRPEKMQLIQLDGISRLRYAGAYLTKSGYAFDALQLFVRFLRNGRHHLAREEWRGRTFVSPPLLGDPVTGSLSEVPAELQGMYLVARVEDSMAAPVIISLEPRDFEVDPAKTYYYVHARRSLRK